MAHAGCGVALLEDELGATIVTLDASRGLVLVDAKSQSNTAVRAGLLPPMREAAGWTIHAIVDHSLVEVIVNNATALVVAAPRRPTRGVRLVGARRMRKGRLSREAKGCGARVLDGGNGDGKGVATRQCAVSRCGPRSVQSRNRIIPLGLARLSTQVFSECTF